MDRVTQAQRSATMRAIRSTNTKPELAIRKALHARGYRYRLHVKNLPGKPDLVFTARRSVIFVHGCFWHGHGCSVAGTEPKTNVTYWTEKFVRNKDRDNTQLEKLKSLGWNILVIWECDLLHLEATIARAGVFLGPPKLSRARTREFCFNPLTQAPTVLTTQSDQD